MKYTSQKGFTLLEILLALFIMAIFMTTLMTSYSAVFMNADALDRGSADFEMVGTCFDRVVADLSATHITLKPFYRRPDLDDDSDPHLFKGEVHSINGKDFSRLRFASLTHLPFGKDTRQGIAEIVYYVMEAEDEALVLKRADNLFPYEEFEEKAGDPVVCEKIMSFTLTYYDEEGEDYDTWDSDSDDSGYGTPRSVDIVIGFIDESPVPVQKTRVYIPVKREQDD